MSWDDWGKTPSDVDWGTPQTITQAKPTNPWDAKTEDEVLLHWQSLQQQLSALKEAEIEFRKYVVSRAFPAKNEGMNTKDLGNGYALKATVKYNYNLSVSNEQIEDALDRIAKIGNRGTVVAERLISWKPSFLLTEYRLLEEEKDTSNDAKEILDIVNSIITISEATPSLDIKEPKDKKK